VRGWCSPPRSSPATPPPALLLRQGFSAARRPGLYSRGADLAAPPLRPARRWLGARRLPSTLLLLLRRPSSACRPDPDSMGADLAASPPLRLAVPVAAALGHATAGRGPALSACASRRRGRVRPAPRRVWATGAVGVRLLSSRRVAAAGGAVGGFYSALRPALCPLLVLSCPGLKQLDSRRLLSRLRDLLQEFGAKALLSFDWASDD